MTGATVGGQTTTFAYAGDGVRASTTTGGATTPLLWDREAGLPQLVADGTQSYVHAGGVRAGIDAGNAATYPLADGVGSVRGRTDGAGVFVGTADYDVFGAPRASTGAGGTFGFAGEQADAETVDGVWRTIRPPRPLSKEERHLIDFLLAEPFPGRDELQVHVEEAQSRNNALAGADPWF